MCQCSILRLFMHTKVQYVKWTFTLPAGHVFVDHSESDPRRIQFIIMAAKTDPNSAPVFVIKTRIINKHSVFNTGYSFRKSMRNVKNKHFFNIVLIPVFWIDSPMNRRAARRKTNRSLRIVRDKRMRFTFIT